MMAARTTNTKWRSFFSSRWFLLCGCLLFILLSIAYARAYYQNYQVQQEIRRLQDEAERLEAKRLETLDLLSYVKSSAYVEEKARTELNLMKNGEHVALIPDSSAEFNARQQKGVVVQSDNLSNPARWWYYFFGN